MGHKSAKKSEEFSLKIGGKFLHLPYFYKYFPVFKCFYFSMWPKTFIADFVGVYV